MAGEETRKEGKEEKAEEEETFTLSSISYVRRKLDYPVPYFMKMHFTDF